MGAQIQKQKPIQRRRRVETAILLALHRQTPSEIRNTAQTVINLLTKQRRATSEKKTVRFMKEIVKLKLKDNSKPQKLRIRQIAAGIDTLEMGVIKLIRTVNKESKRLGVRKVKQKRV